MSALLDTYKANGYSIFELENKQVIYKFTSSGDRSLSGCLYIKSFSLTPEDTMIDEVITILDMTDLKYSCLQNDNTTNTYVKQNK